jgi:cytochrome c oxidase subunit 1/cytochrome c oxidase subunit I+III
MPRRVYTYPADLGWSGLNLLESIGAYVLSAGLLLIAANLLVSLRRGAIAGPDPWHGPTLEWTIPSPPPAYNFAVIPQVTSPYANWDEQDRAADLRALDAGERVLEQGHETPSSTVLDAEWDEALDMPSESGWPILLAATLALVFTMLLLGHWVTASVFAGLLGLVLFAWHLEEPQEG